MSITVLSVASECAPLVKTGGLADVVGALPAALAAQDVDMRVLLPGYPAVMAALDQGEIVRSEDDLFGGPARVIDGHAGGLRIMAVDAPHLFAREGSIYLGPDGTDWPDNPERFAALSWMGARIAREGIPGWRPVIVHCHDWQAGFLPDYLAGMGGGAGTVLTIHNIAFHGPAPADRIRALRLDPERFTPAGYEYWGHVSALKAGLTLADRLTTVSPTYARELMTESFGMGLDGVIRDRRAVLSGILNGIDEEVWNPATDTHVAAYTRPAGKAENKARLRAELGLPDADGPLCVLVSRLTAQKGLDLLLSALPVLLSRRGQLAVLGTGEPALEEAFRMAARDPNVAVRITYDEGLSHRMIAGGDAILVPSRFEPCGLTQLYGLRYGTIPLVSLTGGLADTVINASPAAMARGVATGLQFWPLTAGTLGDAFDRLCDLWQDRSAWAKMQRNAMSHPVGWQESALAYARLYAEIAAA